MTAMLADSVHVRRRFQRSIRVDTDLDAGALEGFVCPQGAAQSLVSMSRQVKEAGQGAFTWTGPYGCGKSSLAVAFAALLGNPALKAVARAAIGADVATGLQAALDPAGLGWAVVPVVGSRADAATAVASALDGALRGKRAGGRSAHVDVVRRLVESAADPRRAGVLVILDEMGKFLEDAAVAGGDVYFFQQLAEAASRSGGRLVVIGILHQAFDDYAHRLGREVRDEWLKIQGRYADIPINVAGEEQVELIARAIEAAARPGANLARAEGVAASIRAQRPATSADLGRRLNECWPLHPVVASLLGPLSRRRFGQNQRSVFGFLNSAEPFGFQEYLAREPASAALPYGPTLLWDYLRANLEPSILASPDGHRWSLAVEAVERSEAKGGDADHLDLVKAIALVDMFKERSGLLPAPTVLVHALPHLSGRRLEACLDDLKSWSVVIYKRHLGAFAIYAGSDFDIDAAVAEARARLPVVDLARLRGLAMLQPVMTKRHYHVTGALRWFEVDIAAIANGADRVKAFRPQQGATGLFLLLLGTEAETDAKARRLWRQAADAADGWPVAVGWTRDSFMIRELAAELMALESVRAERSELRGDAVARREVSARIARLSAEIEDRLTHAFEQARWTWRGRDDGAVVDAAGASLNAIASTLADQRYADGPRLNNELLNRIKPSSNAVAAQKELLKAMVERAHEPRLGIDGFPATGGLYESLLAATGLHVPCVDEPSRFWFVEPASGHPARLAALWRSAEALFRSAASAGCNVEALYDEWRRPPFGVREGLLPVLAVAFLMSRVGQLAVYLDGVFQPKVAAILVDRLTQDPSSVRLRWAEAGDFHAQVLSGVADLVAEFGGTEAESGRAPAIDVARGLVGIVFRLPGWVMRTGRLSPAAAKVRNLAKMASDPNKFLLDDLPAAFSEGHDLTVSDVERVAASVRDGLSGLVQAYPNMLRELEDVMLRELRVTVGAAGDRGALQRRCEAVRGLTGNYRLDAFATRLASYNGAPDEMEGIASLAANKPPRDWVDRDIDHARVEIAALAQEFAKAEALAHVKGRKDGRISMAIYISDPSRPSPVRPEFDVASSEAGEVDDLAAELQRLIRKSGARRDVALAALAELGARLAEPDAEPVLPFRLPRDAAPSRRRKGAA